MKNYAEDIKANIVRLKGAMTHAEVFGRLRFDHKQYYRRLNGSIRWHADEIIELANVLCCSPCDLLSQRSPQRSSE